MLSSAIFNQSFDGRADGAWDTYATFYNSTIVAQIVSDVYVSIMTLSE